MKTRNLLFSFVLLLALFLAACSPQAAPTEDMSEEKDMASETMEKKEDDMMEDKDEGAMMSDDKEDMSEHDEDAIMDDKDDDMDGHDDEMMDDEDDVSDDKAKSDDKDDMSEDVMMMPDWFKTSLMDVNSGETFAVADYKGKVVLVETLAMWCSNCLKQQGQVLALHDLVGERDDFVSLGLDIDPNENAEALKSYTSNNGFDWVYTVAPIEVSREIGKLYGDQYLNPPSTPMLIIDREGEVHLLPFGIKSADDLLEALQPFLDAEM